MSLHKQIKDLRQTTHTAERRYLALVVLELSVAVEEAGQLDLR